METAIDANAPLDYIEFLIFPMQNRYEACVTYLHKKEKVSSGLLEHLLLHSAKIRELHTQGSNAKYGLSPPENSHDIKWFTKSTLIRFLHIIGSANMLEVTSLLKNKIFQLEKACRVHLSLYTEGTKLHQTEELDGGYASFGGSTTKAEESDVTKNKLLDAIDSRLIALKGELTTAFDQAAGSRYSVEEMIDIEKFSCHFGSLDFSDSLRKHIELRRGAHAVGNSGSNQFSGLDRGGSQDGNNHVNESLSSEMQIGNGVSPAKVAHVERQSSTGSNGSSFSSDEEKQIGRSGSRRSTAITIKSLNYIPVREKSYFPADAAASDSEEEGSQQEPKKPDNNVRISVQEAINLFERKQRDQKVDVRKSGSLSNASIGANKSVLRRWSGGMGEDSSLHLQDTSAEDPVANIQNDTENEEIKHDAQESNAQPDDLREDCRLEPCGSDIKMSLKEEACSLVVTQRETLPTEPTDASEKLISSSEWNRQKEAELNELLMKMMETKPVKSRTAVSVSDKRLSLPSEQRGGSYDHYKERRGEKLQGEAAGKRAKQDKQFKPMRQLQAASANLVNIDRKHYVTKMQKPQRSAAEPANLGTESPKPGPVRKATQRSSSVPHTRKSWSSMPSPSDPLPVKTSPVTGAGMVPTRRRPRSTMQVSHSNPKLEASQTGMKPIKPNWENSKKMGNTAKKKQQSVTKPRQTVKSKIQTAPEDHAPAAKPSLYNKVTKKSSVVPLESKPFLRRGSATVSNANPSVKKKASVASPQEELQKVDQILHEENVEVSNPSDSEILHDEEIAASPKVTEDGTTMRSSVTDGNTESVIEPQLKPEDKETILPAVRVDTEEHVNKLITSEDLTCEMPDPSPADQTPVVGSSARVHHSLSQMLLEESSEPDVSDWGNTANPLLVVDQKDAPKGFKKLLKFARKSKTDANASRLFSSSFFSEGEDDTELVSKRSSENLLRKATLHSKHNGLGKPILSSLRMDCHIFCLGRKIILHPCGIQRQQIGDITNIEFTVDVQL